MTENNLMFFRVYIFMRYREILRLFDRMTVEQERRANRSSVIFTFFKLIVVLLFISTYINFALQVITQVMKPALLLTSLLGLSHANRTLAEDFNHEDYRIVRMDPYSINPSSIIPSSQYKNNRKIYDPYIPIDSRLVRLSQDDRSYTSQSIVPSRFIPNQYTQSNDPDNFNDLRDYATPQSKQYHEVNRDGYQLRTNQNSLKYTNINYSYGSSNGQTNGQINSKDCVYPRQFVGGICRCPRDGVYVNGKCFQRGYTPPSTCISPRKLIEGQCICPDNMIFVSGNKCVPNQNIDTSNSGQSDQICTYPRVKTVNGFCLCPNNGDYYKGFCYTNGRRDEYQPIYSIYDIDQIASLGKYFQGFDGRNNNKNNPDWGCKGATLQRRCKAAYKDGKGQPFQTLPNPRLLSNKLAQIGLQGIEMSKNKVTAIFTYFGQFLDHDLDLTQTSQKQDMNIEIPYDDKFFKNQPNIPFKRSGCLNQTIRMHKNLITSWIDGNNVYGTDDQAAKSLRSFVNGKMKTSVDNMLPRQPKKGFFQAGDIRANENVMLSAFHTIFMREHNRICDQLRLSHPEMNDQALYRSARQWVIALIQKISMDQFLPLMLGDQYDKIIGKYNGYKPYLNPNIPTQFATAAFRVGHSQIIDYYSFINKKGQIYQNTKLSDLFMNPKYINSEIIEDAMRGLTKTIIKQKSIKMSDQVRNLLITDPNKRQLKFDLFSLNVQRGRDHGLPRYNQARVDYGLKRYTRFEQIQPDPVRAKKLKQAYNNRIDDVDLFVGLISEQPVNGGDLGELGCQIIGQTFRNLRDGDRYWYQGLYSANIVRKIKRTKLSDIIRRNTQIGNDIQDDIWHYYD